MTSEPTVSITRVVSGKRCREDIPFSQFVPMFLNYCSGADVVSAIEAIPQAKAKAFADGLEAGRQEAEQSHAQDEAGASL
jgi:hypothetical protein